MRNLGKDCQLQINTVRRNWKGSVRLHLREPRRELSVLRYEVNLLFFVKTQARPVVHFFFYRAHL